MIQICISVDAGENDPHAPQAPDGVRHFISDIAVCIHCQSIRSDRQIRGYICHSICGISRIIPVEKLNFFDLCCPSCTNAVQDNFSGIKSFNILEAVRRLIADTVHIDLKQCMRAGGTGVVRQQELIPCLLRFAAVRHSQLRINGIGISVSVISNRLNRRGLCAVLANCMDACCQLRQHLRHIQCNRILYSLIQVSLVMIAKAVCGFQFPVGCDILFCGGSTMNLHIAVSVICRISQRNAVTDALEIHSHAGEIGKLTPRRLWNYYVSVCIGTIVFQIIQHNIKIRQSPPVVYLSMEYNLFDLCLLQQIFAEQNFGSNQTAGSIIRIRIQIRNLQCGRADFGNTVIGNDKASRRSIVIQGDCLRIALLHQVTNGIIINTDASQCRFCLFCLDYCVCLANIFRLYYPFALTVF